VLWAASYLQAQLEFLREGDFSMRRGIICFFTTFSAPCRRQLRGKLFSFTAVHEAGLQGIYLGSLTESFLVLLSEPVATSLCWKGDEMRREHCKPHLLGWTCSDNLFTVAVFVLQ